MTQSSTVFALIWNLGAPELIVILILALVLFGTRIPKVARSLGQGINEFKKGLDEKPGEEQIPETASPQSAEAE